MIELVILPLRLFFSPYFQPEIETKARPDKGGAEA